VGKQNGQENQLTTNLLKNGSRSNPGKRPPKDIL